MSRLRQSIRNGLALASIKAGAINTVFMTGGPSRVPAIEALLREELQDAEVKRGDDFLSVAIGLTLKAQARYG